MEILKEHIEPEYRQREMVRLCTNLFSSIDYYGMKPDDLRSKVERDMDCWNSRYCGVSCDQLKEFILQVVECVFGKNGNSITTQPLDLEKDKVSKGGGS